MDERMVEIAAKGVAYDQCPDPPPCHDKCACVSDARRALQDLLDAGYQIIPPVEGKGT